MPALVCKVPDAAKLLDVSEATVYRLVRSGDLPGFFVGHSLRLRRSDVLALVGLDELEEVAQ